MSQPLAVVGERTACALATRLTEQILDVLTGRRPVHQLRDRVSGPVASLLATGFCRSWLGHTSSRLRSVHACLTTKSRVEACAVIETANRARAFVLRLEQKDTRWCCTMLSVL